MIKITSITQASGYSGYDHLLDDGPLKQFAGQSFRSAEAAAKAAGRALKGTQDRRCASGPVWVSWIDHGTEISDRYWTDGTRA